MKYLLLLLLCFSAAAGAADRFVQVTTNGTLVSPTDFFTVNSNLIVSAISGSFGTGSGSGDVVGPFSAPDGALVVFDGTTGKLIKSATVTESQILTESEASSFYAPLNSPAFTGTVTFDSGTFGTLTITTNLFVADVAYGAGWDSSTNVPTRNAVYDKIQSLLTLFQATNANLTTLATLNGGSLTNLDGSKIASGQIPIARMATGTPDGTKFIRDDGTLATPAGSVTSVGATSTVAGLNFSGTPVTGAGTLSLTGIVGVASIDTALATDAELSAHAALTNSHGVSTLGALLSAQTTAENFRTQLGLGSAAVKADTDFQATNENLTALSTLNGNGLTNLSLPKYTFYTNVGTYSWTNAEGSRFVRLIMFGAGGGGGSGRKGLTNTVRCGGGGGGSGGYNDITFPVGFLTNSVYSVTIGGGGKGGDSITAASTDGQNGTQGTNSFFGNINCSGGGGGNGGTASAGAGGAQAASASPAASMFSGPTGGSANATGGTGGTGSNGAFICPGGGGSGGGLTVGNATASGGASSTTGRILNSAQSSAAGGTAGNAGTSGYSGTGGLLPFGGGGGGGGGSGASVNAGAGGDGAYPGGGGGGGGASQDNSGTGTGNSGAGGRGGNGMILVIEW